MWSLLATWTFGTSRHVFQLGILLTGIGAGFVAIAGLRLRRGSFVGPSLVIAGVLMVVGLIFVILVAHYGVSPFARHPK
ncbi:MAG: hypothetical protein C5B48_01050 [Candidatus Rokuibacteriota bacterium]|nr:MAG: hypothetical protein C5B48_01050 [Candidatus Rokubacteria bacterium]